MKNKPTELVTEWFFDPAYSEQTVKRIEKFFIFKKIKNGIRDDYCRLQEQLARDSSAHCAVSFQASMLAAYSVSPSPHVHDQYGRFTAREPVWVLELIIAERTGYQIKVWLGREKMIAEKAADIRAQLNEQLIQPGINALITERFGCNSKSAKWMRFPIRAETFTIISIDALSTNPASWFRWSILILPASTRKTSTRSRLPKHPVPSPESWAGLRVTTAILQTLAAGLLL
jgi:hypothetical protein